MTQIMCIAEEHHDISHADLRFQWRANNLILIWKDGGKGGGGGKLQKRRTIHESITVKMGYLGFSV